MAEVARQSMSQLSEIPAVKGASQFFARITSAFWPGSAQQQEDHTPGPEALEHSHKIHGGTSHHDTNHMQHPPTPGSHPHPQHVDHKQEHTQPPNFGELPNIPDPPQTPHNVVLPGSEAGPNHSHPNSQQGFEAMIEMAQSHVPSMQTAQDQNGPYPTMAHTQNPPQASPLVFDIHPSFDGGRVFHQPPANIATQHSQQGSPRTNGNPNVYWNVHEGQQPVHDVNQQFRPTENPSMVPNPFSLQAHPIVGGGQVFHQPANQQLYTIATISTQHSQQGSPQANGDPNVHGGQQPVHDANQQYRPTTNPSTVSNQFTPQPQAFGVSSNNYVGQVLPQQYWTIAAVHPASSGIDSNPSTVSTQAPLHVPLQANDVHSNVYGGSMIQQPLSRTPLPAAPVVPAVPATATPSISVMTVHPPMIVNPPMTSNQIVEFPQHPTDPKMIVLPPQRGRQ